MPKTPPKSAKPKVSKAKDRSLSEKDRHVSPESALDDPVRMYLMQMGRIPLLTREEERRGIFANSLAEEEVGTARCADRTITSIRLPASHFAPFLAFARATCDPA